MIGAMVKIHRNEKLRDLGWKLVLQIHDELILEGPEDSAEEALELVRNDMMHPLENELKVDLEVNLDIAENWYEGK